MGECIAEAVARLRRRLRCRGGRKARDGKALVLISGAELGLERISEQRIPPSLYVIILRKTLRRWRGHTLGSRHCRRCRCRRLSLG